MSDKIPYKFEELDPTFFVPTYPHQRTFEIFVQVDDKDPSKGYRSAVVPGGHLVSEYGYKLFKRVIDGDAVAALIAGQEREIAKQSETISALRAARESDFEVFHKMRVALTGATNNPLLLASEALDAVLELFFKHVPESARSAPLSAPEHSLVDQDISEVLGREAYAQAVKHFYRDAGEANRMTKWEKMDDRGKELHIAVAKRVAHLAVVRMDLSPHFTRLMQIFLCAKKLVEVAHEKQDANCAEAKAAMQALAEACATVIMGELPFMEPRTNEQLITYLNGLLPGERVIETGRSGLQGRQGTVYVSKEGHTCVMWDVKPGEEGQMGTTVTGGARRVKDIMESMAGRVLRSLQAKGIPEGVTWDAGWKRGGRPTDLAFETLVAHIL